ncbi:acyl-homoserine-lactone synthase [Erwinia sp. MMLR14_017]|uniref:acyl-homoserine-lactone synthase n=1 Tax=Erwinia sp. MMLR14_017 TaxID=3093842 RepID=UPI00298F4013|nr:acyl-homoserine-lactone synthase [Erwinia sp. MMLR14_017]MDW8845615.1 acyl-homoserine-lactone synthase [Erwinia sp. MMLR14_017]
MLKVYCSDYSTLDSKKSEEIFKLRKRVFKDRLQWAVNCTGEMERDEFDNANAKYIYGVKDEKIICGSRVIAMKNENMLANTFSSFFNKVEIPEGNYIESTRFFVDKQGAKFLAGHRFPVTKVLFMALISYARQHQYDGVIAVTSHPMMQIIKSSGWNITLLETGQSEKDEPVYLVLGHADENSHQAMKSAIINESGLNENELNSWPLYASNI